MAGVATRRLDKGNPRDTPHKSRDIAMPDTHALAAQGKDDEVIMVKYRCYRRFAFRRGRTRAREEGCGRVWGFVAWDTQEKRPRGPRGTFDYELS